jgi:hypothetical protein
MTDRLQQNVIFVNVDGCRDYTEYHTKTGQDEAIERLTKTKYIHEYLTSIGLRSYRLNPIDGDITYVPFFYRENREGIVSYSSFILFELYDRLKKYNIDYSHVVLYQSDGFPINVNKWTDEFLDYDYIGLSDQENSIMNGGFSLRSKKLLKTSSTLFEIEKYKEFINEHGHGNEDVIYHEFGYIKKYPPVDIIKRFVSPIPTVDSFGFHTNNQFDFDQATSLWRYRKYDR